jgi:hypothetical protein
MDLDKLKFELKEKISDYWGGFTGLLRDTKAEVAIGAGIGLAAAMMFSWHHESIKGKIIPLGFSEITQIEKEAEKQKTEVPPLTRYYTSANDLTMKVFECWNKSNELILWGSNNHSFARELENRIDPSMRIHHYEITDFTKALPNQADSALIKLKDFLEVLGRIKQVNSHFDDAWSESHFNVYRPEPRTVVDSNGNSRIEIDMVYAYTIHSYSYDKKSGEAASKSLDDLLAKHPRLELKEKFMVSPVTHADNERAIEKSREKELKGKRLAPEELVKYAGTWAWGSTLNTNMPKIAEMMYSLINDSQWWNKAKARARSTSYPTFSPSDSGPIEFKVAERALDDGITLDTNISQIKEGIDFVKTFAPNLHQKIVEYVDVTLNGKKGSPGSLKRQILSEAQKAYSKNFKSGFDVHPSKWYMVVLWSLAGAAAGAGVGFGVDWLGENFDIYDEKKYKGYKLSDYHDRINHF